MIGQNISQRQKPDIETTTNRCSRLLEFISRSRGCTMGTASTTAGATYGSHPPQHIHGILAELDSRRPNGPQRLSLDKDGHGNLSGQSRRMSEPPSVLIDNTRHIYIPVKLTCGVRVLCRPEVLRRCPLILHDLNTDLRQCLSILPPSVHALVRRTQVWVNHSYSYGPRNHPVILNHSTAHHHEAWLMWYVQVLQLHTVY